MRWRNTVLIDGMSRSEEDNDPRTDDGTGQLTGAIATARSTQALARRPVAVFRPRHHLTDDSDSVDSPTYDGDVESSTTAGLDTPTRSVPTTPVLIPADAHRPLFISNPINTTAAPQEPAVALASKTAFNPAALTPDDIQRFVADAVAGEAHRQYTINPPPTDRPVRIYADGALAPSFSPARR